MIDDSIGLVRGAPHPVAAKLFIDFVGSVEGQELAAREAFRLPARTDLPASRLPPWAQQVLRSMVPAEVDRGLVESHLREWMITWDRAVRGHGLTAAAGVAGAPCGKAAGLTGAAGALRSQAAGL